MKKSFKPLVSFLIGIIFFSIPIFAFAAVDAGVNQVGAGIRLNSTSPMIIAVRIINIILMFLSVIAVCLVIYGGFVWMTSNGREERITIAKNILKNSLIGLVIVLSSWGIAAFILKKLIDGNGSPAQTKNMQPAAQNYQLGLGAVGACVVENFYPKADRSDVPRNTSIMVSFKEEVNPNSVCTNSSNVACTCNSTTCNNLNSNAIQIKNASGTLLTNVKIGLSYDKKTIVIMPLEYLGTPNIPVAYNVQFTNNIKNLRDEGIFSKCSPQELNWNFTVNGLLDLTPPKIITNGVFPPADNTKDLVASTTGFSAQGKIKVLLPLHAESDASFLIASKTPANIKDLEKFALSSSYQEISASSTDVFVITIDPEKNFVLAGGGKIRGSAQITMQNNKKIVVFPNYFSFEVPDFAAGNSWQINLKKPLSADKLFVDQNELVFSSNSTTTARTRITSFLLGLKDKNSENDLFSKVSVNNNEVLIEATPGVAGNNILLSSSRPEAILITPLSGGSDGGVNLSVKDLPDQPMNSAIQINFSKEINPLSIIGPADYVSSTIRVINANESAKLAEKSCVNNSDCSSYKCLANKCVGDYVFGKFLLSSDYRTLEFLSDNECGINGCGEKIYCLPANANLKVRLIAAELEECADNSSCTAKSPFINCASSGISSKKACKNSSAKFYPSANILLLKGVFDSSGNSFDGNRDSFSVGPVNIFNQNVGDVSVGDNFKWSFFTSDKIMADAPKISSLLPNNNDPNVDSTTPVTIKFSPLMLNSSLLTGTREQNNGAEVVVHKLLNLKSFSNPVGYWISSNNNSIQNNGVFDQTIVKINHSPFMTNNSFNAQAGSGIRDIYQNCFKPSGSNNCAATASESSCCFGTPTASLNENGDCQ